MNIKENITLLLERNYGVPTLRPTIEKLLEFNNDQLTNLLVHGVKISSELSLQFIPGVGFRCWNDNTMLVGSLPVAGIIERKLNSDLQQLNS